MPKIGKMAKQGRDRAVLEGLPLVMAGRTRIEIVGERLTIGRIAARIREHLLAMARVGELTVALRAAVQREREVEKALRPLLAALKDHAVGAVGKHSASLRDRGFEPHKKPVTRATTKHAALVKRQATREARGIVGRKRRKPQMGRMA